MERIANISTITTSELLEALDISNSEEENENMENTEREIINNVSGTVAINIIRVAVGIIVFIIAKVKVAKE